MTSPIYNYMRKYTNLNHSCLFLVFRVPIYWLFYYLLNTLLIWRKKKVYLFFIHLAPLFLNFFECCNNRNRDRLCNSSNISFDFSILLTETLKIFTYWKVINIEKIFSNVAIEMNKIYIFFKVTMYLYGWARTFTTQWDDNKS